MTGLKNNRRDFLKRSTAAVATATVLPRHVLGTDGVTGANDQIVVGIIGMGVRGQRLLGNIPEGGRVGAICDVDSRKIEMAKKAGADEAEVFQDYRKLIDRKDLDAIIVSAADHHHILASVLACQSGKDVYCEKPLSLYLEEGRVLVNAARKYDRIVQTGTQQRSMEVNRFACQFVRDGGIGDVRVVECVNFGGPINYPADGLPAQPVPAGVNWDLWQGQAPERPFNERLFAHWTDGKPNWWGNWSAYSNSQVTGLGSHAFDMVQYAMGADQSGPVELWTVEEGPNARVHFRYTNGTEVRLRFEDKEPHRGPRLGGVFVGSKCKMEINRNKFVTNPPDFVTDGPDPKAAEVWEAGENVARGHVQNWFDCIRNRKMPNADVEIGHRTASLCHLIVITRSLGRRLRWDPETETFPEDDQANALLTRDRRRGWELPAV